jgi:predicted component of type VI protein secretion system
MKLTLFPDSERQYELELRPGTFSLGRDDGNNIVIEEPSISGLHSAISCDDGVWYIEDRASTNGVSVNGAAVRQRRRLRNGDQISLGNVHMVADLDAAGLRLTDGRTLRQRLTAVLGSEAFSGTLRVATLVVAIVLLSLLLRNQLRPPQAPADAAVADPPPATAVVVAASPAPASPRAVPEPAAAAVAVRPLPVPAETAELATVGDPAPAAGVRVLPASRPLVVPYEVGFADPFDDLPVTVRRAPHPARTPAEVTLQPAAPAPHFSLFQRQWRAAVDARPDGVGGSFDHMSASEREYVQHLAYRQGLRDIEALSQRRAHEFAFRNNADMWQPADWFERWGALPRYLNGWTKTGDLHGEELVFDGRRQRRISFVHEIRGIEHDREFRLTVSVDDEVMFQRVFTAADYERPPRQRAQIAGFELPDYVVQTPDNTMFLLYARALEGITLAGMRVSAQPHRHAIPAGHSSQIPREAWSIHELTLRLHPVVTSAQRTAAMRQAVEYTLARFSRAG